MLLGEYCEAQHIDYKDCERFQIVCPSCKEPIFKAVRPATEQDLHYLSHYRKDESYDAQCELRVASISKDDVTRQNSESRNQKLAYFLSVLQSAILENEYPDAAPDFKKVKSFMAQIHRQKAIMRFKQMFLDICRTQFVDMNDRDAEAIIEDYIRDIKEVAGAFFDTTFSIGVQKRIAWDLWQHLLSGTARDNFYFLFNHAYIFFMTRIERAAETGHQLHPWEQRLHRDMFELARTSKDRGMEILAGLSETPIAPPFSLEPSNLLVKMSSEISHEMIGCLLRLPYAELLKRALTTSTRELNK